MVISIPCKTVTNSIVTERFYCVSNQFPSKDINIGFYCDTEGIKTAYNLCLRHIDRNSIFTIKITYTVPVF
jgi:hypothetical protein